ncbi:MAG: hypothetical protein LBL36_01850 [Clostridiales Family XIII bacterium]|nr:hypothetical protein [Clostridiales Family XIII bacterium]
MGLFKRKAKDKGASGVDSGAGASGRGADCLENNSNGAVGAAVVENNGKLPLGNELTAVLSAAVSASEAGQAGNNPVGDELAAVLSAAVNAYEADNFMSFAGSPAQMELAAVISATVAAYEGGGTGFPYIGTGPSGLYIRKINRSAGYAPAWGVMGNRDAIDSRRF